MPFLPLRGDTPQLPPAASLRSLSEQTAHNNHRFAPPLWRACPYGQRRVNASGMTKLRSVSLSALEVSVGLLECNGCGKHTQMQGMLGIEDLLGDSLEPLCVARFYALNIKTTSNWSQPERTSI